MESGFGFYWGTGQTTSQPALHAVRAGVVIVLRSLRMHGMAEAVIDLIEQQVPAFDAAAQNRGEKSKSLDQVPIRKAESEAAHFSVEKPVWFYVETNRRGGLLTDVRADPSGYGIVHFHARPITRGFDFANEKTVIAADQAP